jgi:hypothetical protein
MAKKKMPDAATPGVVKNSIDQLSEAHRQKVLDALLAGKSTVDVARIANCTKQTVIEYREKVLLPAVKTAKSIQSLTLANLAADNLHASVGNHPKDDMATTVRLTKDHIRSSPFLERLEKVWNRVDSALDHSGPESDRFPLHAALINQAHKNLELLGRVTGELESEKTPSVAIQIVIPNNSAAQPPSSADAVEIALPLRK